MNGRTRLSLIVAMDQQRVIGRGNELPWRLSADLRRFRRLTMGHHIVMGRKTYESLPGALPGREMIVLTRNSGYEAEHAQVVASLDAALAAAEGDDEVFIIGGAEIYALALDESSTPRVERLYLTQVQAEVEGDVWFPELNLADWHCLEQSEHPADERNQFGHTYAVYERDQS